MNPSLLAKWNAIIGSYVRVVALLYSDRARYEIAGAAVHGLLTRGTRTVACPRALAVYADNVRPVNNFIAKTEAFRRAGNRPNYDRTKCWTRTYIRTSRRFAPTALPGHSVHKRTRVKRERNGVLNQVSARRRATS